MRSAVVCLAVFVSAVCAIASRADAQVRYGSVIVEVRDQSGGAIPGADVAITQTETGLTRNGVSIDVGIATIPTGSSDSPETRI